MMIDILSLWNRWGSHPLKSGILRDIVAKILPYLHTEEIILPTGPRRSGKNTVLYQIMDALEAQSIPKNDQSVEAGVEIGSYRQLGSNLTIQPR